MSVRAIDVGFDLRPHDVAVDLSAGPESMPYDSPDGPAVATGTRDQIATTLARAGYICITARTPNGREVRCEPGRPERFVMQPRVDNYWIEYPRTDDALAAF